MDKLAELILEEYESKKVNFQPLYPAVMVRILPKRKITAEGVILTDQANHKVAYEAIVIRTYTPKKIKVNNKVILMDSDLVPGDHILFPHWSGEGYIPGLNDIHASDLMKLGGEGQDYRLIPARGAVSLAGHKEAGEPYLKLVRETESVRDKLNLILKLHNNDMYGKEISSAPANVVIDTTIDRMIAEFDLWIKIRESVLLPS